MHPINVIEKPAIAGPTTEAICHTELPGCCVRIYTFFGTNKESKKWLDLK
jgi:hypothetical protein